MTVKPNFPCLLYILTSSDNLGVLRWPFSVRQFWRVDVCFMMESDFFLPTVATSIFESPTSVLGSRLVLVCPILVLVAPSRLSVLIRVRNFGIVPWLQTGRLKVSTVPDHWGKMEDKKEKHLDFRYGQGGTYNPPDVRLLNREIKASRCLYLSWYKSSTSV